MRGLKGIFLSQARANRFSFYNRPDRYFAGTYVEADGYVLNTTYGTTIPVQLPRGDYRFFLIGGGGGEGMKYTKGTIAKPTVTSGKYSCAGGGSGGRLCFDVHIPTTYVTVNCVVGAGGLYSNNTTTKAGNGGNTTVSIPAIGLSATCGGGGGGTAKDGGTGTGGTSGANSLTLPAEYAESVYSSGGVAGKAVYLTAWNNNSKWPIGAGGGFQEHSWSYVLFPSQYELNIISKCHVARGVKAVNDFFRGYILETWDSSIRYRNCGYDQSNSNPWCVHFFKTDDYTTWQYYHPSSPGGGAMIRGDGGTASFSLRMDNSGNVSNNLLYDGSKGGAPGVIVIERKGRVG